MSSSERSRTLVSLRGAVPVVDEVVVALRRHEPTGAKAVGHGGRLRSLAVEGDAQVRLHQSREERGGPKSLRYGRGRSRPTSPRSRSVGREPGMGRGRRRTPGERSVAVQPVGRRRVIRNERSADAADREAAVLTIRTRGKTRRRARSTAGRSLKSSNATATRIGARRRPSARIAPARTLRELTGSRSSARARGTTTSGSALRPRRRRSRLTAWPPATVSRETTRAPTSGSTERPIGFSRGTTHQVRRGKFRRTRTGEGGATDRERLDPSCQRLRMLGDEAVRREPDRHLLPDPERRRQERLVTDVQVVERPAEDREPIPPQGRLLPTRNSCR